MVKKSVQYEAGDVPAYMIEQLAGGNIPAFLPVSFIFEEQRWIGIYDLLETKPLSAVSNISIKTFFDVFCQLIQMTVENEKHYLFAENYCIGLDTVYIDGKRAQVKLLYIPGTGLPSAKEQLCQILKKCRNAVSEEGQKYLQDMEAFLKREETGCFSAIYYGEQLQKEIEVCGVI